MGALASLSAQMRPALETEATPADFVQPSACHEGSETTRALVRTVAEQGEAVPLVRERLEMKEAHLDLDLQDQVARRDEVRDAELLAHEEELPIPCLPEKGCHQ